MGNSTLLSYLLLAFILRSTNSYEDYNVQHYLPKPVIGAYFDSNGSMQTAFSLAVRTINRCVYDHEVCEAMHRTPAEVRVHLFHQVEFHAMAVEAKKNDVIDLYRKFGTLAGVKEYEDSWTMGHDYGLALVVGPHDHLSSFYVQGLCETHHIPNIIVQREPEHQRRQFQTVSRYWINKKTLADEKEKGNSKDAEILATEVDRQLEHHPVQTMNLYPETKTLADVYSQMIRKMKWTNFCILYENPNDFDYSSLLEIYPVDSWIGTCVIKLGRGPNYSEPLLMVKKSKRKHVFIDCSHEALPHVLRQAQEMEIMTTGYNYLVTDLDFQTMDVHPFRNSGVRLTGLRLIDPTDPFVSTFVGDHLDDFGITSVEKLQVKDALMFDSIVLFAQAYKDLNYQNNWMIHGAKLPRQYDTPIVWRDGLSMRNYMLFTEINGLTGPVMLDGDGARRRFKLDVLTLRQTGLRKIGEWNPEDGLKKTKFVYNDMPHYRVLITTTPPYAMKRNVSWYVDGNDRYEGFVIDIIEALSREMGFTYTFYVQEDAKNGDCVQNPKTKVCKCNGMMEKVLNNQMDLAITDLTITENRTQCVRFSTSFMNLGMSILFKKSQKAEATWYSFFAPFDYQVWLYLALSYVGVSLLVFALGRLCPAEWTNPYPCVDEPEELQNQFTIGNAFWFTMGAIMQQGSEIAPIGMSTRILAGWWWFFCLIIVSSYTANLAAFLIIEQPVKLLNGINDLVNQTKIKFGAKEGGSTYNYFQSSSNPDYRRLFKRMNEPEWKKLYVVPDNDRGIELAESDDLHYAFFMESSTIEYTVKRHCKLEEVGSYIDHKTYAIAVADNFSVVEYNRLRESVSKLSERSVLKDLKAKWWDDKGAICGKPESSAPEPMTGKQLKGVFIVLGFGTLFSCALTIYEFIKKLQSIAETEDIEFMKTARLELKFIMESKPIKPVLTKQRSMETRLSYSDSLSTTMTGV